MKALEAAAEEDGAAARSTPLNTTSRTPSPRSSGGWPSAVFEQTPLLDAGPAPPDYSQATAYRTFTQPDLYRRRGHGEPVVHAAEDDSDELDSAFLSDSRKSTSRYVRRNWRQVCLMNLAIYSLVVTVTLILRQVASQNKPPPDVHGLSPTYPDHPSYNDRDAAIYPQRNERFHKNISECLFSSYLLRRFVVVLARMSARELIMKHFAINQTALYYNGNCCYQGTRRINEAGPT